MIKIYISNISKVSIGGGYSFLRNFKKGMQGKVEFVNRWQDSDIVFIFSITTIDKNEIKEAKKAGKKIVLRVDNIPRKSRNHRMDVVGRLREMGKLADLVVYQSKWAKEYTGYFIDNNKDIIIRNGVATENFNENNRRSDGVTYLYLNYNDNPNKRFDEALYQFDKDWRNNKLKIPHLIIGGTAPRMYLEHPEWHWDLPIIEQKIEYVGIIDNALAVADLMKSCDYLLIPYFAEASSNTLAEGLACGLEPIGVNDEGGNIEIIIDFMENGVRSIQTMADEYLSAFNDLV